MKQVKPIKKMKIVKDINPMTGMKIIENIQTSPTHMITKIVHMKYVSKNAGHKQRFLLQMKLTETIPTVI